MSVEVDYMSSVSVRGRKFFYNDVCVFGYEE